MLFLKALLFLSVGLIIHNLKESQDLFNSTNESFSFFRYYNFINDIRKYCYCGLPLASGFFSKDIIFFNLSFFWILF
jgi:NADH:ubiquinone oxidoreductase subunit 5 (subunit L)/multisubunit Na+/H+ antiporter MnhA subunit